jgi:hypothetical protein
MTEIVTISATTAALAAEPLRPSARVSGTTPIESSIRHWSEKASQSGDPQQRALMNVVHPPALALLFLTTSQQQKQPQLTRQQAEDEYMHLNAEGLAEASEAQEEEIAETSETEDNLPVPSEASFDFDNPVEAV